MTKNEIEMLNGRRLADVKVREAFDKLRQGLAEIEKTVDELSVQSDWLQSDSTKLDYIKNRPFGTEPKYTCVFDEPIETKYDADLGYSYKTRDLNGWTPAVGEKYLVIVDGEYYEMTVDEDLIMYEDGVPVSFAISIATGSFEICLEPAGEYSLTIHRIDERIKKIDEKYLPDELLEKVDALLEKSNSLTDKVDELSEEINVGMAEIFYTETGEEHHWDDMEQCLYFDITTPLVVGNEYVATIADTEYVVTAIEDTLEYWDENDELQEAPCVKLSSGDMLLEDMWVIEYCASVKDIWGYNTMYFPPRDYYKETEEGKYEFIPHSLKIEEAGKSLRETVDNILDNTVELTATYEDGTTETLILYGEVKS